MLRLFPFPASVPVAVLTLGLALAACAKSQGPAGEGNLLGGARPHSSSGVLRAERLTDGHLAEEGDFWQTSLTTRLSSARAQATFDLGAEKPVACALIQGDNNDNYRLLGSTDGTNFTPLWTAGPAEGAGMRLRQSKLSGSARYVRLTADGGDGLYTVSELALYSTCPAAWPSVDLPRVRGVSPTLAARDALIALGLTWGLFLLLHSVGAPRWQSALGVVPVLAFFYAAWKVADIYPFPNTDEESLVRAVVAFVAGVLVIKESFFPARLAPHPKVARASLGLLAVLALGCYYHFGSNQFMDVAKGRLTVVHTWDMRNYFPTVKYFKEVRFDGMYLACLAAYVDIAGKGDPASVRDANIRDLTDYHMMNGVEAAPQLPAIRARFSPERWEEFKKDMRYFIDTMGPRDYLGSMQDHGGNATPVWMLPAWLIFRNLPASEWTLGAAGFIDPVLLVIFFVVLARTFGLRVMLYTVILFGATDFYQFGSNLMGSTLRQDWLVALGLGACALKKGRPLLGGFLLAYGGLIRAFPAMAALFLLVPLGVYLGESLWRRRRLPPVRELVADQRQTLRGIAGAAIAVVGLLLVTSGVFGYRQAWVTWVQKIAIHAVGPSTNNVGLRNVLAYRPNDTARALVRRQVPDAWGEWDRRQVKNFKQLRPVFYLVNALAFGLLVLGVARRPLHQTTLLGLLLVPFLFYPSNYYCHFVFLLPMAVSGRTPEAGAVALEVDRRLFGLVTAVIAAMSVGQYFTMQEGWTDQRYTYQSFLLLAGFAAIIVALAVEGRRTLATEAAAAPAVPPRLCGDGMNTRRISGAMVVVALALAGACGKNGGSTDAGAEVGPPIDAPPPEAPLTLPTVDFTVIDCPMFDGTVPQCKGPAPLTVSFAPITTGNVSRLLWDFGNQATSSEAAPTHTYALPDSYDVVLLAAPGLSSPPRKGFIEVTANPLGGACDITPQCEAGMTCLCGQAAQCPAAFARGVCSLGCSAGACPEGAVCADLGRGLPPPTGQTWRAPQCLRACTGDTDCAKGQRCRTVPVAGGPTARWQMACFFAFPSDPGAPCRGPGGVTQDDVCLGGRCADLGARGLCTADCTAAPCPSGTACAQFTDGRKLCLSRCEGASGCNEDPLLDCAAPGGPGPLAFTLVDAPASPGADAQPAGYCAPRPCTSDTACAPAGICMGAPTGHCVLPPRQ